MTLYEFNSLEEQSRFTYLWEFGVYLDSVIMESLRINLYAINMFFVEVHYDAKSNTIKDIQTFKHGHMIDKYIN